MASSQSLLGQKRSRLSESEQEEDNDDMPRKRAKPNTHGTDDRLMHSSSQQTIYHDNQGDTRYRVLETLGHGRFGDVQKVIVVGDCEKHNAETEEKASNPIYAVKVQEIYSTALPLKLQREIDIMLKLKTSAAHHNLIELISHFIDREYESLIFVLPFFEADLSHLLKQTAPFPLAMIRNLTRQILSGVAQMHSLNVLHRDLKPNNILYDNRTQRIAITDFGSARDITDVLQREKIKDNDKEQKTEQEVVECPWDDTQETNNENRMSPQIYVVHYRAPELLVGERHYRGSIDIWPIGCFMVQMTRQQGAMLFESDHDIPLFMEQTSVLGGPEKGELDDIGSFSLFFDVEQMYAQYKPVETFVDYQPFIQDKNACDLLTKLLRFGPKQRCTAAQALLHPFFNEAKNESTVDNHE